MYHNIALSGGGIHTVAFIGCVRYLYENNKLDKLHNVIGSSGGSAIALMMVLEYTWEEMRDFFVEMSQDEECKKMLKYSIADVFKVFKKYGMNDGHIIAHNVKRILAFKDVSEEITFIELIKKTGKNLVIPVTNLTQKKIEYISVDTYPEMKIVTAIRMSSSIPILFEPVKYYTDIYVDSLIYDNFPIEYFEDKFTVNTLGLNVKSQPNTDIEIKTFKDYFNLLLESVFNSLYRRHTHVKYEYICNVYIPKTIKNFDIYNLQFVLEKEQIEQLVEIGYDSLTRMFSQETE